MKEGAGLFFDFGGTLMDPASDRLAHISLMEALRDKYIIEPPARHLQTYFDTYFKSLYNQREVVWPSPEYTYRLVFDDMMSRFWGRPGDQEFSWFMDKYRELHLKHVKLFPGVVEILTYAKDKGLTVAMISDAETDYLDYQLEGLGITGFFSTVTTSQEAGVGKPSKKIFNLALEKTECHAANSMYIGDNFERDIMGARAAGMEAILLIPGKDDPPPGAQDRYVRTLAELKPVIDKFFL